jgi:hypothetical protein
MNVNDFIKLQVTERAKAAMVLAENVSINDVHISSGCNEEGVYVVLGLEKLAEIMGLEIKRETKGDRGVCFVEVEGCRFYSPFVASGDESVPV